MKRNRNKKSKGRTVVQCPLPKQFPKLKEIADGQKDYDCYKTEKDSNGQFSIYWDWAFSTGKKIGDGEYIELGTANPDWVSNESDNYGDRREYYSDLLNRASKILSAQEKRVFSLLQFNLTDKGVADKMRINESTARGYRLRIIKKITDLDTEMRDNDDRV